MKKTGLLLACLFFLSLLPLVSCADSDDQAGPRATEISALTRTPTVTPQPTQTSTPAATLTPTAEPGGWVWVKVGTDLNPNQEPVEVCPEKPGRCTWMQASEGQCVIDKIETEMVMNTKIYEYQIDCSCDPLPDEVWPGEEYRLGISCSSDLKYAAEGNSWIEGQVAISYYYLVDPAHRQYLQPYEQEFWFRPWHPDYDGTAGREWVFFGPWGELGDEFEIVARCGEVPCTTRWRYQLQMQE